MEKNKKIIAETLWWLKRHGFFANSRNGVYPNALNRYTASSEVKVYFIKTAGHYNFNTVTLVHSNT